MKGILSIAALSSLVSCTTLEVYHHSIDGEPSSFLAAIDESITTLALEYTKNYRLQFDSNTIIVTQGTTSLFLIPDRIPHALVIQYDANNNPFYVHRWKYKDGENPTSLELIHKKPTTIPRPVLDSLPPINADGKMKPEEPTSFFMKYWMYLLPIGLIVVTQGREKSGLMR